MASVSVIVPVYKVEAFLRPCVDSILAQTFTDFELILVDDGSPDNCGAICDEYAAKDSRVRVIHQENGGLSAARNAGIEWALVNSQSQWLTFVDSDDLIRDTFLERLYLTAKRYNADISNCQMREFSQGQESLFLHDFSEKETKIHLFSGRDAAINQYTDSSVIRIAAWGKLYKKELFQELRFPEGKIHEDQAVTPIVLFQANQVVVTSEALYGYRLREASITHSKFNAKRYDDITAVDGCIAFFQAQNEPELSALAERRRSKLIAEYSLLARKSGAFKEVPEQYRVSRHRALKWFRKNMSDDRYTYMLLRFYPRRIRPHAYWRKIKKTLHIPCP